VRLRVIALLAVSAVTVTACGSGPKKQAAGPAATGVSPLASISTTAPASPSPSASPKPTKKAAARWKAGNPAGHAAVPAAARAADTSHPTRVVGSGTPGSCTSQAVVAAVAAGGVITFNCGPAPVTITLKTTAKVHNRVSRVVLDGGGKVTLSGGGVRRILYMDTCDRGLGYAGGNCNEIQTPKLTVQNLTFTGGNATGQRTDGGDDGAGGGGAIFAHGGRLVVVNSRFLHNRCDSTGPDLGGAAVRVVYQERTPAYLVGSTFQGGVCSNGGALSTLHASWALINSVVSGNRAIGRGANPARSGTPGGGSGGAVYSDGDRFTGLITGSIVRSNVANEGGGAVFFVSNDRTGTLTIRGSALSHNKSRTFETDGLPGIFFLGSGRPY
jgi:hypothetical protein